MICPTGCPAAREHLAELHDVLTRARSALAGETDRGEHGSAPAFPTLVGDIEEQLERLAGLPRSKP